MLLAVSWYSYGRTGVPPGVGADVVVEGLAVDVDFVVVVISGL